MDGRVGRALTAPVRLSLHQNRAPAWLHSERFFLRVVLPPVIAAGVGAVVLLGGWLLARPARIAEPYWTTPPAYVVALGVAWSWYWYMWAVRRVPRLLDGATVAIEDPAEASALARRAAHRIERIPLIGIVLLTFAFVGWVLVATRLWGRLPGMPGFSSAPATWAKEPHLGLKNAILALWAFPIVFGVVSTASLAVKYMHEVVRFSRLDLVDSAPLLREGCRRAARFAIVGGAAWNAAVLLVAVSLATPGGSWPPGRDVLGAGAVVLALSLFGVGGMMLPELVLRPRLVESRRTRIDDLADAIRVRAPSPRPEELDDRVARVVGEPQWVHGYGQVLAVAGGIVIPLTTFFIGLVFQA